MHEDCDTTYEATSPFEQGKKLYKYLCPRKIHLHVYIMHHIVDYPQPPFIVIMTQSRQQN